MNDLINSLINNQWNFIPNYQLKKFDEVFDYANGRIKDIDIELFNFLNSINTLANKEDNVWFVPLEEYRKSTNDSDDFLWNDFELESIQYADNEDEINEIISFWNCHIPFLFSVKNGYYYIAIITKGEDKGSIVYGCEPEYENVRIIAKSFREFSIMYKEFLKSPKDDSILKIFT